MFVTQMDRGSMLYDYFDYPITSGGVEEDESYRTYSDFLIETFQSPR